MRTKKLAFFCSHLHYLCTLIKDNNKTMQNQFSRTQLLLGKPAIDTLNGSRVAVFGVGGVGGYAVEIILPYLEKFEHIWCPFDKEIPVKIH